MKSFIATLSVGVLALLAVNLAAKGRGEPEPDPEKIAAGREAVLKAADAVNGPATEFKALAAALSKDHKLEFVMKVFKDRENGGVGIGAKPGAADLDGIEMKIRRMAQKELPPKQLTAEKADLQRMAEILLTVAEATPPYGKDHTGKGKPIAGWNRYAADMKQGSQDLLDALKANDSKQALKASSKLNGTCVGCHADYRDKVVGGGD
jgi:hypothetical protein